MPIKAVLFDADGVVITPMLQFSRYLEETHAITPQLTRPFFSGVFNQCLTGAADLRSVLPPFLETWGWPGSLEDFIRLWMAKDDCPNLPLLAAIQRLRRAGLRCGLASLQEKNRAAYMRANMGFAQQFDDFFFSCELGCLKPDPLFYQKAQAALKLEPDQILFWDDSARNVEAARALGWHAEVYPAYPAFLTRMADYGIRV